MLDDGLGEVSASMLMCKGGGGVRLGGCLVLMLVVIQCYQMSDDDDIM